MGGDNYRFFAFLGEPRSEIYSLSLKLGLLIEFNLNFTKGFLFAAANWRFPVCFQAWVGGKSLLFSRLVDDFSGIRIWNQSLWILIWFFGSLVASYTKLLFFNLHSWEFVSMWLGFDEIFGFGDMGCLCILVL